MHSLTLVSAEQAAQAGENACAVITQPFSAGANGLFLGAVDRLGSLINRGPSLLVGRVVPFAGAVSFTAVDAQSFLIMRLDFDGAVMVVQLECLRFVGY